MLFIRHWTDSHTQIATLAVEQHEQIKAEEHSERPAGGLWAGGGGGGGGGGGVFGLSQNRCTTSLSCSVMH